MDCSRSLYRNQVRSSELEKVLPVVVLITSQRAIEQAEARTVFSADPDLTKAACSAIPIVEAEIVPSTGALNLQIPLAEILQNATIDIGSSIKNGIEKPRRLKQVTQPQVRALSRMDRIVFEQSPANRELINFARDLGCPDFLKLDIETQAAIRELLLEQKEQIAKAESKAKQLSEPPLAAPRTGAAKKDAAVKSKKKDMTLLLPNLKLSEPALSRLMNYERDNTLYSSFLRQLRAMNDGLRNDKHHVPFTSPKVFQRDAGNGGRVYYRRIGTSSIQVELLGDKNTQRDDYKHLQGG